MVSTETFREMALSFPDAVERPHFDRTSFRVKKIFATLAESDEIVNLKLSEESQSLYCTIDSAAVYPVPNKWGAHGWTSFELKKVAKELLADALDAAYREATAKHK